MVWSQLSFHLHKKQTSYIFENFKPSQIIFSMFPIFSWHFVYFADQTIFFSLTAQVLKQGERSRYTQL